MEKFDEYKSYNDTSKYGVPTAVLKVLNSLNNDEYIFLVKGRPGGMKEILHRKDAVRAIQKIMEEMGCVEE